MGIISENLVVEGICHLTHIYLGDDQFANRSLQKSLLETPVPFATLLLFRANHQKFVNNDNTYLLHINTLYYMTSPTTASTHFEFKLS